VLGDSGGKTLLMASLLLSAGLLWGGEYTEEGVKLEEGASSKEQGESSEAEKELSASAAETEVPMEVSGGLLACLVQLQMSLLLPPPLCRSAAETEVSSWNEV